MLDWRSVWHNNRHVVGWMHCRGVGDRIAALHGRSADLFFPTNIEGWDGSERGIGKIRQSSLDRCRWSAQAVGAGRWRMLLVHAVGAGGRRRSLVHAIGACRRRRRSAQVVGACYWCMPSAQAVGADRRCRPACHRRMLLVQARMPSAHAVGAGCRRMPSVQARMPSAHAVGACRRCRPSARAIGADRRRRTSPCQYLSKKNSRSAEDSIAQLV